MSPTTTGDGDPNERPYAPQVHDERRITRVTGLSGDSQRGMRGKLVESIMQLVVQAVTGIFLPGPLGAAFSQLSSFFSSILPQQILQPLRDLVDLLVGILDSIPIIGPPLGNALEDLAALFGLLNERSATAQATGDGAQSSADVANVRISQLAGEVASGAIPGGLNHFDTFDRVASNLGSAYTQFNTGPAGGTLKPDGNNATVTPTGSGITECIAQINAPTIDDFQTMSVVQNNAIRNIFVPPLFRMRLRENAARTEAVIVSVKLNQVVLEKEVGGSTTTLATISPEKNSAGDLWTFKAGTDNDIRELVVIHNTSEVIRLIDSSGTPHVVGASNRQGSFSERTGQSFVPPAFTNVEKPAALQSVSFYDRMPAA